MKELVDHHLTTIHLPDQAACIARTVPGQAHWAGWLSPPGAVCAACSQFERAPKRQWGEVVGRCGKYRVLMRGVRGPEFPASTPACRHFQTKQETD
jgi:hypothetical protein